MAIAERYGRLLSRRAPPEDRLFEKFAEKYEGEKGDNTRYILGAMRAVDQKYTARLAEQGNRIENQLQKRLLGQYPDLTFRRQGSVSNGTHIRYFSDVDVLTIIDKYWSLEPPQIATSPYQGSPVDDLSLLRDDCARELALAFPKATVDDSGPSAIKISRGSLVCAVDVVPSNWYNTIQYARSGAEYDRGIQVLDRAKWIRITNAPFLFNRRLDINDSQRLGLTRMLIRLVKTIKADMEEEGRPVEFSSFDICSLLYRMPDQYILNRIDIPLDIVRNVLLWMDTTLSQQWIRDTTKVIDESRLIFDSPKKEVGLRLIQGELLEIYFGAIAEQGDRVFLSESHIR